MFGAKPEGARGRGAMSSRAVLNEAVDEAAVSRRELEGLRVDVDETRERVSGSLSRSRLERVESMERRRRGSSSLLVCDAAEAPVSLLHMMAEAAQWAAGGGY